MDRFITAHAAGPDWRQTTEQCLTQLGTIPPEANVGFLYVTDGLAAALWGILGFLKERSRIQNWVGTVGLGICSTGLEYHDQPAISVMIAGFPPDSYRVFDTIEDDLSGFVRDNGAWYKDNAGRFGIVHGDPRNPRLPMLIRGLADELDNGFLIGGLTSSHNAYPQIAGGITEGGLSGLLLGPEVEVATSLSQGFAPFGPSHEVTACEDNILITLDGKPALEVMQAAIGEVLARDLQRTAGYIAVALPVLGSDTGEYLVRNLVGYDVKNKLLAIAENTTPGRRLRFCRRDPASAREALLVMLRGLKARAPKPPKGGVYYSCVARGPHLFGPGSKELSLLREELGEFPLTGFFCNGEISHNRLYGYTGVLTLFF